jgi:hypothetical protein
MVANLRVTIRSRAVWRTCECGALAPLSPNEDRCTECRTRPVARPRGRK